MGTSGPSCGTVPKRILLDDGKKSGFKAVPLTWCMFTYTYIRCVCVCLAVGTPSSITTEFAPLHIYLSGLHSQPTTPVCSDDSWWPPKWMQSVPSPLLPSFQPYLLINLLLLPCRMPHIILFHLLPPPQSHYSSPSFPHLPKNATYTGFHFPPFRFVCRFQDHSFYGLGKRFQSDAQPIQKLNLTLNGANIEDWTALKSHQISKCSPYSYDLASAHSCCKSKLVLTPQSGFQSLYHPPSGIGASFPNFSCKFLRVIFWFQWSCDRL